FQKHDNTTILHKQHSVVIASVSVLHPNASEPNIGSVTSQQCPTDWKNIRSRCYFLSSESKTWEESRRYCLSKGADLVVINTEQEQVLNSKSVCVCV
uniref:C-type lectin domain-containing protein n=1 Tax=Lates calcarifer TaxID=8187 RepID=A0A4W6CFV2_LATCA